MKKFNFKDLKMGKKLAVAFCIILILATLAGAIALKSLRQTGNISTDLFEGPYQITNNAMGIRRDVVSTDQNIAYAIIEGDIKNYEQTIKENFDSIKKRLDEIKSYKNINLKEIDNLEDSIVKFENEINRVKQFMMSGNLEAANQLLLTETSPYYSAYSNTAKHALNLYEEADRQGILFNEGVKSKVSKSYLITLLIGISTIGLGGLVCIYLSRHLSNPLKEVEIAANQMADGDFNIKINYEANDELGSLANSIRQMSSKINSVISDTVYVLGEISSGNFNIKSQVEYIGIYRDIENSLNKITDDLSDTMYQINIASDEVGAASDQVSSGAQMLAQGATEQASAVEELSTTITDISEKIKDTAKNAIEANELSISSVKAVEEGNEQMRQMVKAMEEISMSSNEISRIIKTIDDIAFQTNILALNAAVEAARAGESGKGFAVVADEVRNLAAKSAEAAKNTSNLIQNSIERVNHGNYIASSTEESLRKIIETSNQTKLLIDEIAKASEEQANSINQVTLGIDQISSVVQTNAATSEESAASSEELSGQAQMLKLLINEFKLKDTVNVEKSTNF